MLYDYVIVGGGSAGSTLAARLSDDPDITVCLLEAGGPARTVDPRAGRPHRPGSRPAEAEQLGAADRSPGRARRPRGYQPRGKALGGSSAINAMLYVRGDRSDYDGWAELGCDGWSWNEVLPYFRRSEGNERGADALHGADGPLKVSNQRSPRPVDARFSRRLRRMTRSVATTISTAPNPRGPAFIR